jgi:hypothetical protein
MLPQQQLREAIQHEIDRRIQESLKQYEQYVKGGCKGEFRLTLPHDNAAANRLQEAISKVLHLNHV